MTPQQTDELMNQAKSGAMPLEVLMQQAEALKQAGRSQDAMSLYKIWIACTQSPTRFVALFNWGVMLSEAGDMDAAEMAYRQCVALNPGLLQAKINLGLTLERKKNFDEALQQWGDVAHTPPGPASTDVDLKTMALNHIGRLQESRHLYDQAETALQQSLALKPDQPDAIQHWVHLRQKQCKWPVCVPLPGIRVNDMLAATSPLAMLSLHDDPALQWMASRAFVDRKFKLQEERLAPAQRIPHARIRIGYLSGDLCTHAVGLLMADLIEAHDKTQFEIFAFDFSPEDGTAYRARLKGAFDHVIDLRNLDDRRAALTIRQLEIDVLIDLHGLSSGSRPGIMALHPAHVQGTYLGFIGTTAMPWIDFVVTDPFALPEALTPYFTEEPLYIEGSFIPLHTPVMSEPKVSRTEVGLPEDAVVLASFNNIYKYNAELFSAWMRILKRCDKAVLWLLDDNPWATEQLQQRALEQGVSLDRLVLAKRCTHQEYRERLRLADLYLDTYPYNAGSTARDVLDARLPMVTLSGKTFISRMAGSMLHAAGVGELVTHSHADYEDTVVALAHAPERIAELKQTLELQSATWHQAPARLTASLEQALLKRLL
ncbi:Spy Predicted O-linked N-acetylglucosamine transferase, SPINDLY family [Burkholderiaceae bacterium]